MNQRFAIYSVKPNGARIETLIAGPDNKVIADTDIPRVGHISEVRGVNAKNAQYIVACLNACAGMTIEALEALPASFNMLLSDGFKRAIAQPAIVAMITEEQTRDFIEKWNALPQTGGQIVPMPRFELMPPIEVEQIAWLQKAHTLHRQVEMLYVVDGYEVTITWDETPISEDFKGETLSEAISKAMAGFDLHVRHPYQDREKRYPADAQREALEAQRNDLLAALISLREDAFNAHIDSYSDGALERADAAISKAEGGDV